MTVVRRTQYQISHLTPRYPYTNRLVESSNKTIRNTIRKIEICKEKMGRRTSIGPMGKLHNTKVLTGQTPFSLVYGREGVLLVEMHVPTLEHTSVDHNLVDLSYYLDAIKGFRESITKTNDQATFQQKCQRKNLPGRRLRLTTSVPKYTRA